MKGEYMDVEAKEKGGVVNTILNMLSITFVVLAFAQAYILVNEWQSIYKLHKAEFICTKIEQVGKNLDDVKCVQYTNQKYSKEAIAFNTLNGK